MEFAREGLELNTIFVHLKKILKMKKLPFLTLLGIALAMLSCEKKGDGLSNEFSFEGEKSPVATATIFTGNYFENYPKNIIVLLDDNIQYLAGQYWYSGTGDMVRIQFFSNIPDGELEGTYNLGPSIMAYGVVERICAVTVFKDFNPDLARWSGYPLENGQAKVSYVNGKLDLSITGEHADGGILKLQYSGVPVRRSDTN